MGQIDGEHGTSSSVFCFGPGARLVSKSHCTTSCQGREQKKPPAGNFPAGGGKTRRGGQGRSGRFSGADAVPSFSGGGVKSSIGRWPEPDSGGMALRMAGPLLFCMTGFSECSTPDRQEGKNYFSERAYSCSCCLSKAAFICWNACSSLAKSDISRPITVTVIAKHTARNINAAISHHSHSNTNKTTTSQLTIRVPMNKTSDLTSSTSLWKLILTSVNCCVNLRKSFRALVFIYLITYASPVVAFHDALCIINTKGKACAYAKSRYQGKREQFLLETHGHSTASEYTVMVSSTPSALVAVEFAAEWGFVRRGMGLTSFLRLTS